MPKESKEEARTNLTEEKSTAPDAIVIDPIITIIKMIPKSTLGYLAIGQIQRGPATESKEEARINLTQEKSTAIVIDPSARS